MLDSAVEFELLLSMENLPQMMFGVSYSEFPTEESFLNGIFEELKAHQVFDLKKISVCQSGGGKLANFLTENNGKFFFIPPEKQDEWAKGDENWKSRLNRWYNIRNEYIRRNNLIDERHLL